MCLKNHGSICRNSTPCRIAIHHKTEFSWDNIEKASKKINFETQLTASQGLLLGIFVQKLSQITPNFRC